MKLVTLIFVSINSRFLFFLSEFLPLVPLHLLFDDAFSRIYLFNLQYNFLSFAMQNICNIVCVTVERTIYLSFNKYSSHFEFRRSMRGDGAAATNVSAHNKL